MNFVSFFRIEGTFSHLFWALFGYTNPSLFKTERGFEIIEVTGQVMFAAYVVSALLVALNVLIAMLTNTFQKVSVSRRVIHRFEML